MSCSEDVKNIDGKQYCKLCHIRPKPTTCDDCQGKFLLFLSYEDDELSEEEERKPKYYCLSCHQDRHLGEYKLKTSTKRDLYCDICGKYKNKIFTVLEYDSDCEIGEEPYYRDKCEKCYYNDDWGR